MPEIRECIAHFLYTLAVFNQLKAKNANFTLIKIWADYTREEDKERKPTNQGHVFVLGPEHGLKRGYKHDQTPLWPDVAGWDGDITLLTLEGMSTTSRALSLEFGKLHFRFAYLTHTSVQWYTSDQWQAVQVVHKDHRGFKIGIAFEFQDYVLAFPSNDNLVQPHWVDDPDNFPEVLPDVFGIYVNFLASIASWLEFHFNTTKHHAEAFCETLRNSSTKGWTGVGVYTISEICFLAGVSPFLTTKEVIYCPSRVARLCEALWVYSERSFDDLPELLQKATHDTVLAPSLDQRLKYADMLHVFAKDKVRVPERMASLVDEYLTYWEGPDQALGNPPSDVFDPALIVLAFTRKQTHLGSLIFGPELWDQLVSSFEGKIEHMVDADPITQFYAKKGLLSASTRLKPEHYSCLLPNDAKVDGKKSNTWKTRPVFAYMAKKKVWSVTPDFPEGVYKKRIAVVGYDPRILSSLMTRTMVSKLRRSETSARQAAASTALTKPQKNARRKINKPKDLHQDPPMLSIADGLHPEDDDFGLAGMGYLPTAALPSQSSSQLSKLDLADIVDSYDTDPLSGYNSEASLQNLASNLHLNASEDEEDEEQVLYPTWTAGLEDLLTADAEQEEVAPLELLVPPKKQKQKRRRMSADKHLVSGD
ncbi:hypothetical protein BDN72DRAFT_905937 [Pluteus cervinus]|uniref:Uncharacterized protein n=1 Tax=Pluteus cervinus TaxID=181527 RepID=A0ACD3A0Z4_9AGAR|nr:hypothetical protein BDN72DRAFT_905937 [Pluteus cervinus]